MKIKTIVHFDKDTISATKVGNILTNNCSLKNIITDYYSYDINDITFLHALLLLGLSPNRFGYDLSHYLNSVQFYLKKLPLDTYIKLNIGSSDFKRRASEDLGVAISSLFMVETFKLLWQKISQIPINKSISKFTPDFIGLDANDDKYIYESKGTTSSANIEKILNKAIEQAKSYSTPTKEKLALVSYFPNDNKTFPSYTFIADPPVDISFEVNDWNITMLHYLKVFEFIGLNNTYLALKELLKVKFRLNEKYPDNVKKSDKDSEAFDKALKNLQSEYFLEATNLEFVEINNRQFIGRTIITSQDQKELKIFLGVLKTNVEKIIKTDVNLEIIENQLEIENNTYSIFSDGTILRIS